MEADEVRRHLEETGAQLSGHFLLSSGQHSDYYVQCSRVLAWPARAALLGAGIGELWQEEEVDLVVGPAMGGILIAHEVARYLGCPCMFTERADGKMELRRGFQIERGARVLVVEDVVTTGGSAREVVQILERQAVEVLGVTSIVWRKEEVGEDEIERPLFGELPFRPLLTLNVAARAPRECVQCQAGKPFEKPGSRPLVSTPVEDAS